ncbi:MAG TPA: ATP-binding protein [Terriglobales bacterium]
MAAFLLVIGAATVTLDFAIRRAWENSLREEIKTALLQKANMLALRVENVRSGALKQIVADEARAADARVTIIDSAGDVLADSEANPGKEGRATHPEFIEALKNQQGNAIRHSDTVGMDFVYVAVPIHGGAVGLAYPLASIQATTAQVRQTLLKGSALALVLATLMAWFVAHSMTKRLQHIVRFAERIAAGDLSARIAETSFDEIAQVASALDKTARTLERSFTELQSSRSQLETVLNSMQDAVIAISPQRKVQWANRSLQRLLPAEARPGISVVEAIRDPDFLNGLKQTLEQNTVTTAKAQSFIPGRTFNIITAPLPHGGAVAVFHDISETERVEKTRRDFIANVSHELRTPLTSIHGYTETLLDSIQEEDHHREFLEIIRKNTARMSRLTEDLLTLARVESGEQRFRIHPAPARELLHDALQSFTGIAHSRGITLTVEQSEDKMVMADREAIHQVFSNLIENAIKYGAEGRTIQLGMQESRHGCEFYVRDFGSGIGFEHLPRLFERFYRVDKARSRETGGTGLGLAIVKHIVLAHQGKIRVESELNRGSTFYFTLPLAPASIETPAFS